MADADGHQDEDCSSLVLSVDVSLPPSRREGSTKPTEFHSALSEEIRARPKARWDPEDVLIADFEMSHPSLAHHHDQWVAPVR